MMVCPICGKFPVVKPTGFCYYHHNRYIKDVRIFKKDWIIQQKG